MNEIEQKNELKFNSRDYPTYGSSQLSKCGNELKNYFNKVELDVNSRRLLYRSNSPYERAIDSKSEINLLNEMPLERRQRKQKEAVVEKMHNTPQYITTTWMGIFIMLLLIIGVCAALKAPIGISDMQVIPERENINLFNSYAAGQYHDSSHQALGKTKCEQTVHSSTLLDNSLPPFCSTPIKRLAQASLVGQKYVKVKENLDNTITHPQSHEQVNSMVANSTLLTVPTTIAPNFDVHYKTQSLTTKIETKLYDAQMRRLPILERQRAIIKTKHKKSQIVANALKVNNYDQFKRIEKTVSAAPVVTPDISTTAPLKDTVKATTTSMTIPALSASLAVVPVSKSIDNVDTLKKVYSSSYTLQLSSSSNYAKLNSWAKKINLKNYEVYKTIRNGQPWYMLVSGIYNSKDEAKRVVSTLPLDVQAKKPWAKPIYQVQVDLR